MTEIDKALIKEFSGLYPDKKLYGVPNKVFMHYYNRFPYNRCCYFFFGKDGAGKAESYISVIPLLKEGQDETLPKDMGMSCEDFIYADDLK